MTRETKIGLLVGLAFIIVIGILLSDYNRIENPALLTAVAENVRTGASTPHNNSTRDEIVVPPTPPTPAHPVPTREEVKQETKIAIGFSPAPVKPAPASSGSKADASGGNNSPPAAGEQDHAAPPAKPIDPPHAPQTVNGARQYIAIAGDTVSKLAGRFLGANTRTNREAILALNPALKANPNNVIVGRVYMIPAKPGAAPTAPAPKTAVAIAPPTPAETSGQTSYTVKDNDSLWRIAEDQLGDGASWVAIRDLNRDILKGGDSVRKGMRLRLPPKSVASTN